jgi:DNA-binding CsgD family transcriptional regulator
VNEIMEIVGREAELQALIDWITHISTSGGSLLVYGATGIGKTALLTTACERTPRDTVRVIRVSGVRSEADVPLAGLHQLLRPLLRSSERIARPHRETLLASFGLSEGSMPDTFRIAVATLELLAKQAEAMPTLVTIDDAQWLDATTSTVLGFVARRLGSERLGLIIATRGGPPAQIADLDLPALHIAGLNEESSTELVDATAPDLDPGTKARVIATSRGNPLALTELAMAAVRLTTPVECVPHHLALTRRLQDALLDSFHNLPGSTQALLLIAAADEKASLHEVLAASELLYERSTVDDLAPAIGAAIVIEDHRAIRFCDPLLPMAIYRAATSSDRNRVHKSLAAVITETRERQTWHRAASMTGPDESLAAELQTSASVVARTRGVCGALAVMERAAHLTPNDRRRFDRLLSAAECAVEAGYMSRASSLIREIDLAVSDELARVRISLIREMCEPGRYVEVSNVDQLADAAEVAISAGETEHALSTLELAAMSCWLADHNIDARRRITRLARSLGSREGDPRVLSILAICEPQVTEPLLRYVSAHPAHELVDPRLAGLLGAALHIAGAFEESAPFLALAISGLRDRGYQRRLAQTLTLWAWNRIYFGDISAADRAAGEATTLSVHTRQPAWGSAAETTQSMTSTVWGRDDAAASLLSHAEATALPLDANGVLADIQFVRAFMALGNGRYDEAFQHLQRTFDERDPAYHRQRSAWRIAEYAEAALHSGNVFEGRLLLARMNARPELHAFPGLRVRLVYARALLAEDEAADERFEAAIGSDLTRWPLYRARLLLEYGTWLRRRRKIADARSPLRAALEAFLALGAASWAERARMELRASRESRVNPREAWEELTEQEWQIAKLAAEGLSNREIAQRLYVSHRTVGSHLYRIFPKLGVSSRSQLSGAIRSREPASLAG